MKGEGEERSLCVIASASFHDGTSRNAIIRVEATGGRAPVASTPRGKSCGVAGGNGTERRRMFSATRENAMLNRKPGLLIMLIAVWLPFARERNYYSCFQGSCEGSYGPNCSDNPNACDEQHHAPIKRFTLRKSRHRGRNRETFVTRGHQFEPRDRAECTIDYPMKPDCPDFLLRHLS